MAVMEEVTGRQTKHCRQGKKTPRTPPFNTLSSQTECDWLWVRQTDRKEKKNWFYVTKHTEKPSLERPSYKTFNNVTNLFPSFALRTLDDAIRVENVMRKNRRGNDRWPKRRKFPPMSVQWRTKKPQPQMPVIWLSFAIMANVEPFDDKKGWASSGWGGGLCPTKTAQHSAHSRQNKKGGGEIPSIVAVRCQRFEREMSSRCVVKEENELRFSGGPRCEKRKCQLWSGTWSFLLWAVNGGLLNEQTPLPGSTYSGGRLRNGSFCWAGGMDEWLVLWALLFLSWRSGFSFH